MLRSCRFKMWIMYWQAFYWELWNWTAQYEYLNSLIGMNMYSIQNEIWQVERYIRCFSEVTKETIHTTNTQNGWSWCQWCKYSSLNIYHILHFPDFVFFFRCRSRYCQQWPLSTRVCVKSRQFFHDRTDVSSSEWVFHQLKITSRPGLYRVITWH